MKLRFLSSLVIGAVLLAAVLAVATHQTKAQDGNNLSGDWSLNLYPHGVYSGSCFLYLVQNTDSLSGALGCYGFRPVRVNGTVNAEQNVFTLSWEQLSDSFTLEGPLDGGSRGTITISSAADPVAFDMYRIGSVWGDPDCSFSHAIGPPQLPPPDDRAIDALLLLQHEALLATPELPCLDVSDVNLDQHVDSRDAMLILQVEAGLIPRLPVL